VDKKHGGDIPGRQLANHTVKDIVCSGALFYAKSTGRFLFLLRNNGRTSDTWGIVGGRKEEKDSNNFQALQREIVEEIGSCPEIIKTIPLELFVSKDDRFFYHTYLLIIEDEFIPKLNDEHTGWAWTTLDCTPKPLHQGLKTSLSNKTIRTKLETVFEIIDIL
jgi:8-oxo-dGTP pyrophosphatase MutT (NUDIX family)